MQIKTWQKVAFFGSIGALILFIKRQPIINGAKYVKNKLTDFITSFSNSFAGKIKEIGDNAGFSDDVFQNMMKKVGWHSGEQWCMYFAKAMHYEAYKDNPTEQSKINKILNGLSQLSFKNAENDNTGTYTTIKSGKPKVGDIFILQHYDAPSTGHAGIVRAVHENTYDTTEGNTSLKGVSDGQGVYNLTRPIAYGVKQPHSTLVLRGFIRKVNA
jgi:hypothetical protein